MKKSTLFLLCVGLLVTSCGREEETKTAVTFKLPESVSSKAGSYSNFSISSYMSDELEEDSGWSGAIPTGILGDGTQPINCYAVMYNSLESSLRQNICGQRIPGTEEIDTSALDTHFYVGGYVGAAPEGAELTLELEPGNFRRFFLVGFHVTDTSQCKDIAEDFDRKNYSRPYVVGRSDLVNLVPGGTTEVPINMEFDETKWFDMCQGPDFDDDFEEEKEYATSLLVRRRDFPRDSLVENTCTPVEVIPVNNEGLPKPLPPDVSFLNAQLFEYTGATPAPVSTYDSYDNCTSEFSITASPFLFTSNEHSKTFWMKDARVDVTHDFYVEVQSYNTASGPIINHPMQAVIRTPFDHIDDSKGTFYVVGPRSGIPGEVYKYVAYFKQHKNSYQPNLSTATTNAELLQITGGGTAYLLPGGIAASCGAERSGAPQMIAFSVPSATSSVSYCMEFPDSPGEEKIFELRPYTSAVYAKSMENQQFTLTAAGGSEEIRRLLVNGPKNVIEQKCHGPFSVSLANEFGTAVKAPASNVSLFFEPHSITDVSIHTNDDCTSSDIISAQGALPTAPISPLEIQAGNNWVPFYVKIQTDPSSTGPQLLKVRLLDGGTNEIYGERMLIIHEDD